MQTSYPSHSATLCRMSVLHIGHFSSPEDRLRYVRSASRGWLMPAWPYPKVGFRPVLAPKIEVPQPTIDPKYNLGTLTPENSRLREIDLIEFRGTKKEKK